MTDPYGDMDSRDESDPVWRLYLSDRARSRLTESPPKGLEKAVALALWTFISSELATDPMVAGKPLTGSLRGYWSARRGVYRVVYELDVPARAVHVLRIEHRSEVYQQRRHR